MLDTRLLHAINRVCAFNRILYVINNILDIHVVDDVLAPDCHLIFTAPCHGECALMRWTLVRLCSEIQRRKVPMSAIEIIAVELRGNL
jgi:hypothetical protein